VRSLGLSGPVVEAGEPRRAPVGAVVGFLAMVGSLVLAASASAASASLSAATKASTSHADAPNALKARIRTVDVSWGKIGYRAVGHGPPLLLLIGGGPPGPSIDDWPPSLIDRLARTHRVFAMDYEGIGRTTLRSSKSLGIDRLADDAASFIRAMGLGRTDVMGWSMGGMVAQALAIRHPLLVRRLVLCASALGDGSATPASVSGQEAYPAQWLFPFGPKNRSRATAFERSVHTYRHYYEGSTNVANLEGVAIYLWLQGDVADGHLASQITVPTLVGDGTKDVLAPPPDSAHLARALPNARLKLYSDAGHGFLIQHQVDWVRRVNRFLLPA
jgi:pimeloyl-ACP methyl ester carboxylesterase